MSLDPWTTDVRTRARNLKQGLLDPKDLEKHLRDLPDLEAHTETMSVAQPAVLGDDEDDDDEDEDDEDEGLFPKRRRT